MDDSIALTIFPFENDRKIKTFKKEFCFIIGRVYDEKLTIDLGLLNMMEQMGFLIENISHRHTTNSF